jgi:KDO2-lipid IV(A) lauroyltransferase
MTKEATKSLEQRIAADPGNWFWIHRRWKHKPTV